MFDNIFDGLFASTAGDITVGGFLISVFAALVLGIVLALVYMYRASYTKSFAVTLAILPAVVSIVIMMVSGSIGAGVAVAGTFSLVRFRSVPGTAKEIGAIFLAMAVGLACGMGYPVYAALFTVIMGAVSLFLTAIGFGAKKNSEARKCLHITVPEDLEYGDAFDDIFEKYTSEAKIEQVKTTNLGSLNKLTYNITLKDKGTEKQLIDELRCRNGNLEISCAAQSTESRELL